MFSSLKKTNFTIKFSEISENIMGPIEFCILERYIIILEPQKQKS